MIAFLNLPQIAKYEAIALLHESDRTLVYRGRNLENGRSVVIKLMSNEYPSFGELVRFRNQYAIVKNLEIEGIIKPYALECYENRYALIMEDSRGISLAEYKQNNTFNLQQFLEIAIQLTDILHQLHQQNIIHKDIKPANILIHPQTQQIKLIDFSISSLLPKETQTLQTPNVLEGTLAYLSPEQTGRMNRGIDYRSDFYSLGVTFYELLAGSIPFTNDDPLELIHAHIAQNPTPLDRWVGLNGKVCPKPLSNIVLKLMAKNAEDRYQSAFGLKYDLEKCLAQYRETQEIEEFALGERDICDRFSIPEKLYGRETEVQTLLDAFERVASPPTLRKEGEEGRAEIMLVAGFSGIGKTAVVNEVHKPIVRQRGYFIKGKFDQFQRNVPFSAFVIALRNLMEQLLSESDAQLAQWRDNILTALGENARAIVDVIPELELVIGKQPSIPELSGSAAQNRFNLLFQKFIQVFTTKEHPLVIFIDDLQWADSASLKLMQLLGSEGEMAYLLLLGAYRDNEVSSTHPLMLTLSDISKSGATINTITLASLKETDLNGLIADTLICDRELARPLTELIYKKTQGNPFFATQFLKGLHEDGLIAFNPDLNYWFCDMTVVQQSALTDDVVEFMATRLHKLPSATQNILKLAACIGNQFDLETLAVVSEQSRVEVATHLWEALQEGLVLPLGNIYKFFQETSDREKLQAENLSVRYKFLHDRVQQAAYSSIPQNRQKITHLKIGQLLLDSTPQERRKEKIFQIVDSLNIAIDLIVDPQLKEELIDLNVLAAEKAKAVTAYDAAFRYLQLAIERLRQDSWTSDYETTLNIYNSAVEAAYLSSHFSEMEAWTQQVLTHTASIYDRIPVMRVKLQALSASEQAEVVGETLDILAQLDVILPEQPTVEELASDRTATEELLARQSTIASIAHLPTMRDPHYLAVAAILQSSLPTAYRVAPDLFQLMVFKLIQISIEYGNTSLSSFGYACYALMCCSNPETIDIGYEIAQMALAVAEKMGDRSLQARTLFVTSVFVHVWKLPFDRILDDLQQAYRLCLDAGDLEFVGHTTWHYCYKSFFTKTDLTLVKTEVASYIMTMEKLAQQVCANFTKIYYIAIEQLVESGNCQETLQNFQVKLSQHQQQLQQENDLHGLFHCGLSSLIFYYWFGESKKAVNCANFAAQYINTASGDFIVAIFDFYYCLAYLQQYWDEGDSDTHPDLKTLSTYRDRLLSVARHAPMNYQHKYDLVQAECSRVLGNKMAAIELYDRAITGAKENGYLQDESLANERFAKFYLDWGKEKYAALHMQEAYYCYARWGAKAKTNDLEERYPQLLQPILQRDSLPGTLRERSSLATATISKITSNSHAQTETIAHISSILDFSSLLKASQILSGEIKLDRLLSTLMKIVLENAGATKGALLLTGEQGLTVEVIATRTNTENDLTLDSFNQPILLEDYQALPIGLINYVRRTTETSLFDAQTAQAQFAADNYLLRFSPQSLLCLPLLERGNLIGILYLENTLTADAFTKERVDLLDALCTQAAISLANARLYQQAQQALKDLQQAQLQMVQNEKMAILGNLVAGVAHEINNPVGFISGNISAAREHLQDLLYALDLYQQKYPDPELVEELEDLDLDFVVEDFPQLIASMQEGVKRIGNISTSLRTFSRTDTDAKTEFNLHEGIDSTLLILKYRLKANEQRPAIEIVKNYGEIPEVKCYAGQLNQVFMNLLANAIDALDESNRGKTYAQIEKTPNYITIKTELSEDKKNAIVRITDNGVGMPEKVKAQIFEQGFTTKGVGKGTGLGMAIAKSIVEEKHNGSLSCRSELGKGTEFIVTLRIS